ncbi:MAG: YkgJ family cysteine cluster protein [Cyanobacteria bacterium]|nr:YkgJ family cysteine cluster protein [Cyanobacteriota bacterium]
MDDLESPLGLAKQVEQLLKMPQSLCKQRGICCRVATFKGSLSFDEIKALAQPIKPTENRDEEESSDEILQGMARDFVSVFLPYPSQEVVKELAPEFVDRIRSKASEKGQNPDAVSFFHCKYVLEDGRCGVHEDRPVGCRTYPFPHENTIFHPGCGFEKQGAENWNQIKKILDALGLTPSLESKTESELPPV